MVPYGGKISHMIADPITQWLECFGFWFWSCGFDSSLRYEIFCHYLSGGRTGLVVRASDSGSGDPGSILGRVGVLFP